ncbi:unnamed protein product [Mytilus coruscus]|uniref:Ig-like domain-containing protein n=1 Tax=Mytilus coruscus TaxID=42192 RepID=A0A6J8CD35_MYTCO|nr:unnamed protein product [Mytilus coruscus]
MSFDKDKQLTRNKVILEGNIAIVIFNWSKTIQMGSRILKILLVENTRSALCPLRAYMNMCKLIPADGDSPAFLFPSKHKLVPVTYIDFHQYIKEFIIKIVTFAEILHIGGGGGRLVEPPGRSSLWRLNSTFQPVNENDHRVNCGGFEKVGLERILLKDIETPSTIFSPYKGAIKQWLKSKGKCGICGDPFDGPLDHENGEKYDHKFISRTFKQNEIINVTVEIIEALSGYIEFRICDNSNDKIITSDCLDSNVLEIGDTKYKKYNVWNSGYHVIPLQLPVNLTCDKCLLQFRYHTGYRWGCDGDDCCYGCGPMQEEFYSCADIRIMPDETLKFKTRHEHSPEDSPYMSWWCIFQCLGEECNSTICSKQEHLRLKRQTSKTCKGTGLWTDNRGMDFWCRINCLNPLPYCPPEYCECDTGDVGTTTTGTTTTTTRAPTTTPGRLFVYINPIQSTATVGDVLVQIQCFVTGIPVADTWYWTRKPLNGGPITTIEKGTNNADYIVDNSPTSPSLSILGITKADEADYTCYATNAAGPSSSSSSRLYVNGDLLNISIEPESFTILAGDASYKILCIITGSPQASSWYWTKTSINGSTIITIGQGTNNQKYTIDNSPTYPHLTIKDITEDDEGDYECHATNGAGQSKSARKSRLLVTGDTVTNIVRVLASAGCQYCNKKNNVTCANWYCSEVFTAELDLTGTLTSKVNQLADNFCSFCETNDTACIDLFCLQNRTHGLPNRRMVSLSIEARCNVCSSTGIQCQADPECGSSSSNLQSGSDEPAAANLVTCRGIGIFANPAMDIWCQIVCPQGFCPPSHCECGVVIQTSTTTTKPTTEITHSVSGADLYSANAMNGIMCSVCNQQAKYSDCSTKYCNLYNPNLEEPQDTFNNVFSYSPEMFCQLAITKEDTNLQKIFCYGDQAVILSELESVMCTACQNVGNGAGCEAYCVS